MDSMRLSFTRPRPARFIRRILAHPATYQHAPTRFFPYWLRGFTTEQIQLYQLTTATWRDYLPEFLSYRITLQTNRHVWPILHDKLVFDAFMREKLPVAPLLAAIVSGTALPVRSGATEPSYVNELLAGQRSLVIKPLQGGGGSGVAFVHGDGEGNVFANGLQMDRSGLESWLCSLSYHGVYERVVQHATLAALHPATTNTLRVHMFRSDDGTTELLGAALRVGVARSAPVDNFNRGALSLHIDPTSGITTRAVARGSDGAPNVVARHPDTDAVLAGIHVPHWNEVYSALRGFHDTYPAFDLVGWDVALTVNGFQIIEGNHNPELRTTLVHDNLGKAPAFRSFCERRGLIPSVPDWVLPG
jgi:hypothetical protein